MAGYTRTRTDWTKDTMQGGSAHGERLFIRQHIRPEMMQYRDGQPWANGWIHANTHGLRLDEGHSTGRSAPGEQPVTRQHVRPARTQHGEGEHLWNNFLIHEDTHVLVVHDEGRVSPWRIAGQTRIRTFWKKRTVRGESDGGGQLAMQVCIPAETEGKRSCDGGQSGDLISHAP